MPKAIRPVHLYGAAVVAGLCAVSGYGFAQLRHSTTELRACVQEDGTMRWAGSLGRCRTGERLVSWNQRGPQGLTGPSGERGSTGSAGAPGPAGPPGNVSTSQMNAACMLRNDFGTQITGAPATSATGTWNEGTGCMLGEIRLFSGNYAPRGWVPAAGQLLPIAGNETLFSLVGVSYGGDGRTNFALPDLRAHGPKRASYVICMAGVYPGRS